MSELNDATTHLTVKLAGTHAGLLLDVLVAELDRCDRIIRAVAQYPPTDSEYDSCSFCGEWFGHDTGKENDPANHGEDCPWRWAKTYVKRMEEA